MGLVGVGICAVALSGGIAAPGVIALAGVPFETGVGLLCGGAVLTGAASIAALNVKEAAEVVGSSAGEIKKNIVEFEKRIFAIQDVLQSVETLILSRRQRA